MEMSTMSWTTSSPVSSSTYWNSSATSSNRSVLSPGPSPGLGTDALIERFQFNRRVNDSAFFCLVAAYCALIVFGTLGNSLVVFVVARQPTMRTARNVFVVNLAISDLLLCLITMPLTLMEIRSYTWPLGNTPVFCKMVGSLQAVSIFVSTLSITAIALDRYQLIVYPTKRSFQLTGALLALVGIWIIGVVLALPLFVVRRLEHHELHFPNLPFSSVDYCLEDWPTEKGRSAYSIGSILVQYALPIATVSVAHARICNKLRFRMTSMQQQQHPHRPVTSSPVATNGQAVKETDGRKAAREEQLRKTNTLLVAIAIIFTICWLPMNTFNVVVDTWNVFSGDTETEAIVYAVCHMVGMSSACANPLLYGWLNDNFRKEFHKIGASLTRKTRCNSEPTAGLSANVRASRMDKSAEGGMKNQDSFNPNRPAATTAVTMLPSSNNLPLQTEVTAVTHLVAEPTSITNDLNGEDQVDLNELNQSQQL